MKVGILTFQFPYNYGAMLQAYALKSYIEKKGNETYVLPYFPVPCTAGLFVNSLTAITRPPGPPSSGPDAGSWLLSCRQYSGHPAPSSPAPAAVPLHQTGPLPLSATGIVHMHP